MQQVKRHIFTAKEYRALSKKTSAMNLICPLYYYTISPNRNKYIIMSGKLYEIEVTPNGNSADIYIAFDDYLDNSYTLFNIQSYVKNVYQN